MDSIITWNIPNFVTVGVMGFVMFTVFGLLASWYAGKKTVSA